MMGEADLVRELDSAAPSFRLTALDLILRTGRHPSLLEAVKRRGTIEDHPECRILLGYVRDLLERRLNDGPPDPPLPGDPEAFGARFAGAGTLERLDLLACLPESALPGLVGPAGELLEREPDPIVAATIIRVFHQVWPLTRVNTLLTRMTGEHLALRLAALPSLTRLAPETLVKGLPALLIQSDPLLRAGAIACLAALDLPEAIAHLGVLLRARGVPDRQAGLRVAASLPFREVKPLLFRFLAQEQDEGLIDEVGPLLGGTPDREVPFRLLELADLAPLPKAERLRDLYRRSCRGLLSSGLLGEAGDEYFQILEGWTVSRAARRFVQECFLALNAAEGPTDDPAVLERARGIDRSAALALGVPAVREAFRKALLWPIPTGFRDWLARHLDQSKGLAPYTRELTRLSPEELVPMMAFGEGLVPERPDAFLAAILAREEAPPEMLAAALQLATRLELAGFQELAARLIDRETPPLGTAALGYLARLEPRLAKPRLSSFLSSPQPLRRGRALRIQSGIDAAQALSNLRSLLESTDFRQHKRALDVLPFVDLFLVGDQLASLLRRHRTPRHLEAALGIFQADPDPASLFDLMYLEASLPAPENQAVRDCRLAVERALEETGMIDPSQRAAREQELTVRLRREQARADRPKPDYALGVLRTQIRSGMMVALQEPSGPPIEGWGRRLMRGLSLAILLALILGNLYYSRETQVAPPGPVPPSGPLEVWGVLAPGTEADSRLALLGNDGVTYLLASGPVHLETFTPGDHVRAVVVPLGVGSRNQMAVEIRILEKR